MWCSVVLCGVVKMVGWMNGWMDGWMDEWSYAG